ncbi:MAG: hypothetical protein ACXVKA_02300 [Acidimicrobiia bacterium]
MEEARRLLERQEADLDTLRSRVATILTGSSIVAAVFGAAVPDSLSRFAFGMRISAFTLFGCTAFACIQILWPRQWRFTVKLATWVVDIKADEAPSGEEVAYNLAKKYEEMRYQNAPKMLDLQQWFTAACCLLGLQVVAWALVLV